VRSRREEGVTLKVAPLADVLKRRSARAGSAAHSAKAVRSISRHGVEVDCCSQSEGVDNSLTASVPEVVTNNGTNTGNKRSEV
jgi:hypothetical protein